MAEQNAIDKQSYPLDVTSQELTLQASVGGYASPTTQYAINGTNKYVLGNDRSDDFWTLGTGNSFSNETWYIEQNGLSVIPFQPYFLATDIGGPDITNITGDGTTYTVALTETIDENSNYSSPTFTAPIAGKYLFACMMRWQQLGTGFSSVVVDFNHNSGTLYNVAFWDASVGVQGGSTHVLYVDTGTLMIEMAASDTMTVEVTVSGGGKTVDLGETSYFSGYLMV